MVRILSANIYTKNLPVENGPYTMAGQTVSSMDTTIVQLIGENGLSGWGEVCPLGSLYAPVHTAGIHAALKLLVPALIGKDALPRNIHSVMDQTLNGHNYARAALDIAVFDLLGKSLKVPVSTLLGGAVRSRIKSYYVIGIESADSCIQLAKEKAKEGYRRLQVKIGRDDIQEDIEVIKSVYDAVGNSCALAVDANRGLSGKDAILISNACRDVPFILEQPCDQFETNRAIKSQLCHPLYLDENITDLNIAIGAISSGFVDGFGMKITRLGGLSNFATFRDLCAARGIPHTVDDGWGGNIIAAAQLHMAATVSSKQFEGAWLATPYQSQSYGPDPLIAVDGGGANVPEGPGLGINPNPELFDPPIMSCGT